MVRCGMEAGLDAALWIRPARRVASELEREHARDVRRECKSDQIHHQMDVLLERIGDTDRRLRHLPLLASAVVRLHFLNAALELADVVEILVEARAIAGPELPLQLRDLAGN